MGTPVDVDTVAHNIQVFMQRAKRWPSELAPDPAEVALACWLQDRRDSLRAGTMAHRDQARLTFMLPGWRQSVEAVWLKAARRAADTLLLEGAGAVLEDPTVHAWLRGQLAAEGLSALETVHSQWLDRHAPEWRDAGAMAPKTQ